MRVALLANPDSGSGEAEDAATALRAEGAEVERFGLDQLDAAASAAPERVVVAGGDGSIGPVAELAARIAVPLAVIPVGTANDFVRAMGIPGDPVPAASLAAGGERTRRLDLGRMGETPFVNVASLGLAPAAAASAEGLKRLLGPAAYALGAMRAGLTARPVRCAVRCDGEALYTGSVWQVTVACSGAFGGGADVEADPRDGLLDAVVIEAGSRAGLVLRAWGLRRGTVGSQQGVHTARGREVRIEAPPDTRFNVDGEIVTAGPAAFSVEPGAFELVVG